MESNITNVKHKCIQPAVNALVENIEKCTGLKPPVFDESERAQYKKYPYLLLVGESSLTKKLGINASALPREGFIVKTFSGGVAIVGNDSSLIKDYYAKPLSQNGTIYATLWGSYDFLERFFGCRFYFPGKYGSLLPKVKNLVIAPVTYKDHPRFRNRSEEWFYWTFDWNGRYPERRKHWESYLGPVKEMAFAKTWRLARTSPFWAGHNPNPQKFVKAYPDKKDIIFYRAPNGNLYYNKYQHIGNYFDVTNLKFADLLIESLKKYYSSNGKINDGWCALSDLYIPIGQCDSEVPLFDMINNPIVKKNKLITAKDIKSDSPYSNIYARFYQYLGNRLNKEFPGKKIILLPYSKYTFAPLNPKWKLPDNIELRVCIGKFPAWVHNKKVVQKWKKHLQDWYAALGNRPVASLWLYNVPRNAFARAVVPQFIGECAKACGKLLGDMDLFFDQHGNLEFYYYYSQYAGARCMWNPDFNVTAAIAEHWEPFYGKKAGGFLREFYKCLLDMHMNFFIKQNDRNPLYPISMINKLEKLLAQAKASIKKDSIEMKRFRLFVAPWEKAFASQRNRHSYSRPLYGAYRLLANEKAELDGKGNEPFWAKVAKMPTLDPNGNNKKIEYPSDIKIAWDKEGIYGLITSPYPPKPNKKASIWKNSNVEIFIAPGTKKSDYFHYAVDTLNKVHYGAKEFMPVEKPYNSFWCSPGFRSRVTLSQGAWTLEFFVPFADLKVSSPHVYDSWFINIVTNKNSMPMEYSSSAMTIGNNHNIRMFGIIKFLGKGE